VYRAASGYHRGCIDTLFSRGNNALFAPTEHAPPSLCCYVAVHPDVLPSRVDAPATLTIDEPAFLVARVQARELGRERIKRRCYVA